MKNKTCGECKHFKDAGFKDPCEWVHATFDACFEFEPKQRQTNSEKIRQMDDEEWATMWSEQAFLFAWCYDCMEYCKDGSTPENRLKCKNRMLNWLNSPAESEVEDGE